jgi:SAM-dependent methyltransferase
VAGDLQHGVGGRFEVYACERCGAGTTRPEASPEELALHYPAAYGPHGSRTGGLSERLSRLLLHRELRVGAVSGLARERPGRLLDVGSGDGELGGLLVESGWSVTGIEPSAAACRLARERRLDAREGTLETVELEPAGFDAALFHHSLEHFDDPGAALSKVGDALRSGGLIMVSAPNFDCRARRRFGADWFHLDLPRHRVHLGEPSLALALRGAGLDPERIWTTTSPVGLIGSLQYRLLGRMAVSQGPGRRVLGQLVALAMLPVTGLQRLLGGGGDYLHAVARKR